MQRRKTVSRLVALAAGLAILATACGSNDDDDSAAPAATTAAASGTGTATTAALPAATGDGPGVGSKAVGFIFVGPKDDFGYNQAAYDGSQAVKAAFPDLDVITAEN